MATHAHPATAPAKKKKRPGLTPFGGSIPIAVIGVVATFVGFAPTFFLRLSDVSTVHLVHGWTMTAWILLVLVQSLLIRSQQYSVHRILGWSSLALFVAMVLTSLQVMVIMLSGKSGLPFEAAKFFGYSDVIDMPLLLLSFGGAIYWRKNRHLHSRLMAITVLTSIVPALARMFNILIWRTLEGLYLSMHPTYWLILSTLGTFAFIDWKNNRLRWPLPLAFVWFSGLYASQWAVMNAQWYDSLAKWLGSFG